jgi:HEAT repeat protein
MFRLPRIFWSAAAVRDTAAAVAALLLGASTATGRLAAQEPADPDKAIATADTEAELLSAMELAAVATARQGAVARAVADAIQGGLPPEALLRAIDALLILDRPREAGPVLLSLTRHRRVEARRRAVAALAELAPEGAAAALRTAVGDPDREVRETAMLGLGRLGDRTSVPTLLAALEAGSTRALTPLAQLVGPEDVPRILDRVGRTPLDRLEPALRTLGTRGDLPESVRVDVVARLRDLGTARARSILEEMATTLPRRGLDELRGAIDAALRRLPDA